MPTYEYACRDCGQHLEVVQSFKDSALTTCGACNGALRKVFSAAGIIFKGSGYYVTDTRKKAADAASAKSGEGTSDKPASDGAAASSDSASSSASSSTGTTPSDSGASATKKRAAGGAAESA